MKIGQVVFENASLYEKKSRRVDLQQLALQHQVISWVIDGTQVRGPGGEPLPVQQLEGLIREARLDILHVYGPAELPAIPFRRLPVKYVGNSEPRRHILPWCTPPPPAGTALPFGDQSIPEAVEEQYFGARVTAPTETRKPYTVGTLSRGRDIPAMHAATNSRLARFREDIDWRLWTVPPTPSELAGLDLWVDPATDHRDLDGWVAEALVTGVAVVAGRTPANQERLADGKAGFLVPPDDPNELTHAVATALFKPEQTEPRRAYALQSAERFRPENRVEKLLELYESLLA